MYIPGRGYRLIYFLTRKCTCIAYKDSFSYTLRKKKETFWYSLYFVYLILSEICIHTYKLNSSLRGYYLNGVEKKFFFLFLSIDIDNDFKY